MVHAPDRSGAAHDTEIIAAVGPDSPVRPVTKKSRLLPTVRTCVLCGKTAATKIKVATEKLTTKMREAATTFKGSCVVCHSEDAVSDRRGGAPRVLERIGDAKVAAAHRDKEGDCVGAKTYTKNSGGGAHGGHLRLREIPGVQLRT